MNEIIDEEWALFKAFVLSFFDNFQLNRVQPMNQPTKQQTDPFIEVKLNDRVHPGNSMRHLHNLSTSVTDKQTNRWRDRWTVRQTDEWRNGKTDRWIEGWTDPLIEMWWCIWKEKEDKTRESYKGEKDTKEKKIGYEGEKERQKASTPWIIPFWFDNLY